jgi:hypothetical protein
MPANPTTSSQQVTVTSPTQLRSSDEAFAQALARDIETIAYQLNQLSRTLDALKADLRARGVIT